jgi:hypothetical protein
MLQVIGSRFHLVLVLCAMIAGYSALAQSLSGPRISQPIDDHLRVSLPGNVHPLAQLRNDLGPVPDSFPAQRMLLLLERSPSSFRMFTHPAARAITNGSRRSNSARPTVPLTRTSRW